MPEILLGSGAMLFFAAVACLVPLFMIGITAVTFGPMLLNLFRQQSQANKLRATGETATATILSLQQTGLRVNSSWQVNLLLQVQPANGPAFQAQAQHLVSIVEASQVQPGATAIVRYDPNDKSKVTLVNALGLMANSIQVRSGQDPVAAQEMVLRSQVLSHDLMERGEPAQAQILKTTDTGIVVYGSNPFYKLWVQVRPTNRLPFEAEVGGVILQQSLPKYQPGSTIRVKFDPKDTTRLTVERSGA